MLRPAILHQEDLVQTMINKCWFNEYYKYFNQGWNEVEKIEESTEKTHQFVSVNKNGQLCGIIFYHIDRRTNSVCGLNAASFRADKLTFAKDLRQAIDDIFCKFNFRKLCFGVVIGNPVERTYDRFIERYGGRIAALYKEDTLLQDGTLADIKVYELFKTEYMKHRKVD